MTPSFLGKGARNILDPAFAEVLALVYAGTNGLEVGHGTAQPTLVDVQHTAAFSFTLNHFLA
ncbi:MAG: hypothetical protein CM1200mP22_27990 [Dehalococcoidia bacterium]|nr:MAG: hypothetical protein CM1200mP22_27990 [Dehalococcoidia bacterium]